MRTRFLTATMLAFALVVSACGGDDDAETTEAPATTNAPATTAGSSDAPATTAGSSDAPETTAAAGGPVGSGSMSPEMAAQIDETAASMLEVLAGNGGTAFYVAISDPDRGDYLAAYGNAGVDGPAATTDDTFRIGSITKTFTASVILQLIDEGELALDDTVEDVSPGIAVDFPELAPITIEQLLGMTSGIEDFLNVPDSIITDVVEDPSRVWEPYELIEAGIGAGVGEPGTPGYSTTNYIVLQLIAEELTGEALQDLITERLVDQDDLGNIFYPPNDDTDLPEPMTRGYVAGECVTEFANDGADIEDGTDTTDWSASASQGGGQMSSDIASLLNWAEAGSGSDTLTAELAAQRVDDLKVVAGYEYGLGIFKLGTNWFGHAGEAIGWEALALTDPDTGVSIAVATNGCGGQILGFATFIDALYPDGEILQTLVALASEAEAAAATTTTTAAATTTTAAATTTTAAAPATTTPSGGGGTGASGVTGTVVMTVGDTTVEADIVECTVAEPDVQFRAEGETAQIVVAAIGGGETSVSVSGGYEFEGTGTAAFNPDTSGIDQGDVMIVGQGAQPDDSAPVVDFTVDARGLSC